MSELNPPQRQKARPQLKVCGITDAAFAVEAARRGIGYLGFIFAENSPRRISPSTAREISDFIRTVISFGRIPKLVGVFVSHSVEEIDKIAQFANLNVIQLHSRDYSADDIEALKSKGYEVWQLYGSREEGPCKCDHGEADSGNGMATAGNETATSGDGTATSGDGTDASGKRDYSADEMLQGRGMPDAVLLDGTDGKRSGGTGKRADWSLVPTLKRAGRRVVLAGGISSADIADAMATGADVIDINSSIETAPGTKSTALLDELLEKASPFYCADQV